MERDVEKGLSCLDAARPMDLKAVFADEPPSADYIVPGVLAGGIFGVVGPGGVGKSCLVINLFLGCTIGNDLIGGIFTSTKPGNVLYLPNEDPMDEIHRRVNRIKGYITEADLDRLVDLLEIIPLKGLNPWIIDGAGQPIHENIDWLRKVAQGKRLVILDTLRRFHLGNENDSGQMSMLLGILETIALETGCTFAFLHHCSKGATLNGSGDNSAASRGSGVLTDNARGQYNLVGVSKQTASELGIREDLASWYVQLVASKVNHGRPQPPALLQRQPGGVLVEATPGRIKDLERIMLLKEREAILDGRKTLGEILSSDREADDPDDEGPAEKQKELFRAKLQGVGYEIESPWK